MLSPQLLRTIPELIDLPEATLCWLLDNGWARKMAAGDRLFAKGDPVEYLWLILAGRIEIVVDMGDGNTVYYNSLLPGDISGLLPYSRLKVAAGVGTVTEPTLVLGLHKEHFAQMQQVAPELVQRLVWHMLDRGRDYSRMQLQREKRQALSKMSAGLAHELNNPLAAILRTASQLGRHLTEATATLPQLLTAGLSPETVRGLIGRVTQWQQLEPTGLSALDRSDHEDALINWLEKIPLTEPWNRAEAFVKAGLTVETLAQALTDVPPTAHAAVLEWLEGQLAAKALNQEIEAAATRAVTLVEALKGYTHMDRPEGNEPVDLNTGLRNTVAMLNHELSRRNITVEMNLAPYLPPIHGSVAALNQVWTLLIENAADAMPTGGTLTLHSRKDPQSVHVQVADTGVGIPVEVQPLIFDPFFTTKGIGKGTGLGLNTVSRILTGHHADIEVESIPGNTVFTVSFPLGA